MGFPDTQTQPFGVRVACPACNAGRFTRTYCEESHMRGIAHKGSPDWIDDTRMGADTNPHLHVQCQSCQYEWLEYPAWKDGGNGRRP